MRATTGRPGGSRWRSLAALMLLLVPSRARAQLFTPAVNPFQSLRHLTVPPGAGRFVRLQLGAHLAVWDYPTVAGPEVGSQHVNADPGALFTGEYFLSRHLSLGGWWNPFGGELTAKDISTGPTYKVADLDASFWDLHATYFLPESQFKGWSIEAGFSHLRYDLTLTPGFQRLLGRRSMITNLSSPVLWVHYARQAGTRDIGGSRRPIRVFGSVGYYTSSQYHRAGNLLAGGAVPLTRSIDFSSSVWINDFDETSVRVTFGLAGSF